MSGPQTPHVFLVAILLLFLPLGSWSARAQDATPAASPTPNGVLLETLYALTLPVEAVPAEPGGAAFLRFTVAPGTSFDFSPSCWVSPAVDVWYVEAGSFAIRPAVAATVVRGASEGNGAGEAVGAGTEVVLEPGDLLLYPGLPAMPGEFRNAGDEPVMGLVFGVWGSEVAGCPPTGMVEPWVVYVDGRDWSLPSRPLALKLERLTLAQGARAPFPASDPEADLLVLDYVDQGVGATTGAGAARTLENTGDEPVVALALTITSAATTLGRPAITPVR